MINWLTNWISQLAYRLKHGTWCDHPKDKQTSVLIDFGRHKMFWCQQCGKTEFI